MVPTGPATDASSAGPPTVPLPVVPAPPPGGPAPTRGLAAALRAMLPAALSAGRVDPGRPGATALALVAAAAAVVAAVGVWSDRPRAEPVSALPVVAVSAAPELTPADPAPTTAAAAEPDRLVVSVTGKVLRPGLVEVPDGSRVADAVAAAGGPLPGTDVTGINLARRVSDGEQIAVGVPPAPDAAATGSPGASGAGSPPEAKVDLNRATPDQLDALPGVGPVTAQRIVEWRTRHGRFARIEQLREVEGIGERRFGQLRELVTV